MMLRAARSMSWHDTPGRTASHAASCARRTVSYTRSNPWGGSPTATVLVVSLK